MPRGTTKDRARRFGGPFGTNGIGAADGAEELSMSMAAFIEVVAEEKERADDLEEAGASFVAMCADIGKTETRVEIFGVTRSLDEATQALKRRSDISKHRSLA